MKHTNLRHDKTCLNCGTIVPERFCTHCGQENTETKESFGHLLHHFFADVTHYDSQLFSTLKYLILRPGYLTREYNAGKRLSYLNPIRMYIFISAVFFLVMFSGKKEEQAPAAANTKFAVNQYRQHLADSLRRVSDNVSDTLNAVSTGIYNKLARQLDTVNVHAKKDESVYAGFDSDGNVVFKIHEGKYKNIKDYEAVQKKLSDTAKDGAISRYLAKKIIGLKNRQGNSGEMVVKHNIAHDVPKIMFVLLPLFALFVSIMYGFYNKQKYFYSQHAIFTLHYHSFVFLAFLVLYLLTLTGLGFKTWLVFNGVITAWIFVYLVAALHTAYQEKVWVSFVKALTISIGYVLTLIITMCIVFVLTFIAL